MSSSRHLAAVMFTDISGYTALMGDSEARALELLEKNRILQQPIIDGHNGKIVKELGDGLLVVFDSALEAVACAVEIQQEAKAIPELNLKIGIHLGDINFANNDVFGDGVNIASRLQEEAEPGQVLVSPSVKATIFNQDDYTTEFVKVAHLKNVSESLKLYEIRYFNEETDGSEPDPVSKNLKWYVRLAFIALLVVVGYQFLPEWLEASESRAPGEVRIAVLPFKDLSEDGSQQYFADGVMEDIIFSLHKLGLKVKSSLAVEPYRERIKGIQEIGQELQVDYIIAASLQKSPDNVKLFVEYLNAKDGELINKENYEQDYSMGGLSIIQKAFTNQIVSEFRINISPYEIEVAVQQGTENIVAYNYAKKGKEYYNKGNVSKQKDDFQVAIELLKLTILEDSNYVEAYEFLTHAFAQLIPIDTAFNWLDSAQYYGNRGIELDKECGGCYSGMARLSTNPEERAHYYENGFIYKSNEFLYSHYVDELLRFGNIYIDNRWERSLELIDRYFVDIPWNTWYQMLLLSQNTYYSGSDSLLIEYLKYFEVGMNTISKFSTPLNIRFAYYPMLQMFYDFNMNAFGDRIMEKWCKLDNCNSDYLTQLYRHFYSGDYVDAIKLDQENPRERYNLNSWDYLKLMYCFWKSGQNEKMIELGKIKIKSEEIYDLTSFGLSMYDLWCWEADKINFGYTNQYVQYAVLSIIMNEQDKAIQYLRKAVDAEYLMDLSDNRFFESIYTHPEFMKIVQMQAERRNEVTTMINEMNYPSAYMLATTNIYPDLRIQEDSIPK
jgi:TolB-like protein